MFSAIVAVINSIPVLDAWFKLLARAYFQAKLEAHDRDFIEAMGELVMKHDQRKLEEAIGSPNAGKPAVHREGVKTRPRKDRQ